jgi:diguanylate cyclase (GGDEF)-like protein/PAS domain S-box-containing protein
MSEAARREGPNGRRPPPFVRSLTANVAVPVVVLGLVLVAALVWQGAASSRTTARREVTAALDRSVERLKIFTRGAEMASASAARIVLAANTTSATMRAALENLLPAFEQRPELGYMSIALAETGDYGVLERTPNGGIVLWLFPGASAPDQMVRSFTLNDTRFILNQETPPGGYDPRTRPFYLASVNSAAGRAWLPSYHWVILSDLRENPWGISYALAVRDESEHLLGVVSVGVSLPSMNSFLRDLGEDYATRLQLVELGEVPHLLGDRSVDREPVPLPAALGPVVAAPRPFVGRVQQDEESSWTAARRLDLEGVSWMMVASQPAHFIAESLRKRLFEMVLIALAIGLGSVLLSLRMARRMAQPLLRLQQRVAGSERDEPVLTVPDECEFRETLLLGEAFNRMAVAAREREIELAAQNERLQSHLENTPLAVIEWNDDGRITSANAAALTLFDRRSGALLGQPLMSLVAPEDHARVQAALDPLVGRTRQKQFFARALTPRGRTPECEWYVTRLDPDSNGELRSSALVMDISELRGGLARFQALADSTPLGILVVDQHGRLVVRNSHLGRMWKTLDQVLAEPDRSRHLEMIAAATRDPEDFIARIRWLIAHPDEVSRDMIELKDGTIMARYSAPVRGRDGQYYGRTWVHEDITEQVRAEQQLRRLATQDDLTGLPNRHMIRERIDQAIAEARGSGLLLALLYMDLDRFKVVNDGYGHAFGDEVLKAAGQRLAAQVRADDTVARHGGDEFLVLMTGLSDTRDVETVARKMVASLNAPVVVGGREIHLSGSIGVSIYPRDGADAETLLGNADLAMYRAKGLGRNTFQFFTPAMSRETQLRLDLETRLRGATATGELELHYQPKLSLHTGRITGCEALLRWQHPELGEIAPSRFIPLAEESGLIVPIGDWALRRACTQAKAWLDAGLPPTCVAVNISARQFLQQDVVAWVLGVLRDTGLPAELLELELTESLIAQDFDKTIATVSALGAAGVKMSIDDFGTGYSSLSYLRRFHVDRLKIDQSFVRDLLTDVSDATISLAIISLAHSLQFKVIAEGVETGEQCAFLRMNGCDEIQGFYFSKPLPAEEFAALLREDRRLP